MPRKARTPAPTSLAEQQAVEAAHSAELAANPVVDPAGEHQADVPLFPSTPPELLDGQGAVHAEAPTVQEPHQGEERSGPKPVDWSVVEEYANRHGHRPGVDKRVVKGVHLNLLDHGNHGGMGVVIDVEKPEHKPTQDETALLKEGRFRYKGGEWRAEVDWRDPAGSRGDHHRTFDKFAAKYGERQGGEPER